MGMAASQARLLSITARMHDVEYQAQNIMNQKVLLATQEDAAYEDYCAALDAKKIQVAYGVGSSATYVDATFNSVCRFDESGNRTCQYALTDAESGKMIVDQEVYDTYKSYSNDKYSFAWAMLGFCDGQNSDFCWDEDRYGNNVGSNSGSIYSDKCAGGNSGYMLAMTEVEEEVYLQHFEEDSKLEAAYNAYIEALEGDDFKAQKEALADFREELYSNATRRAEIYDMMRLDKSVDKDEAMTNKSYISGMPEEFDDTLSREFEYYVRLFEGIEQSGGCILLSDFSKDGSSDNEWFNNVINSGTAILNIYNTGTSNKGWTETSIATSTSENYLKETQDETDLKKAEAKYEYELNVINRKETKLDQDLNKLETERTALNTELESIKKVKDDNIERTFGIFS